MHSISITHGILSAIFVRVSTEMSHTIVLAVRLESLVSGPEKAFGSLDPAKAYQHGFYGDKRLECKSNLVASNDPLAHEIVGRRISCSICQNS